MPRSTRPPRNAPPAPPAPPVEPPAEEREPEVVTSGNVALPRPPRRSEGGPTSKGKASPKVHARDHGTRSRDIGGRSDAGDAFAAWLRSDKGLDPDQRFGAAQLRDLTEEFKARPIHGHRRTGSSGDNHRPNPEHLRGRK